MNQPLLHPKIESNTTFKLLCCLIFTTHTLNAQVTLVQDLNFRSYDYYDLNFSSMVSMNDNVYFNLNGTLWRTDGSYEGTRPLKTFAAISNIIVHHNKLMIAASSEETGYELWTSDGTSEGTSLVKDIHAGINSSLPRNLIVVNDILYFVANDGKTGTELWKSDGTASGTTIVKDILKVSGSSNPQNLTALNGLLYFSASDGATGYELWRTDGTAGGTFMVADIYPGYKKGSNPKQVVNSDGTLYFVADDGINGRQLWKSNGSLHDASLVKIINQGSSNFLNHLTAVSDLVFFQANDGLHGSELWRSDGTEEGTFLLADITPGPGSKTLYATPHLDHFKASNGRLYFLAVTDGQDLWTSDGTPGGTYPITHWQDINFPWIDHHCAPFNNITIFGGSGYNGFEVWKTDGTINGTSRIKETFGDPFINNMLPTASGNHLYFIDMGALWKTDGTPEGTVSIRSFAPPVSSMPLYLTDVNGTLFFQATDNSWNFSLWKTDGTASGTAKLHEYLGQARHLSNTNGDIYFAGQDYNTGIEPWISNGTAEGTRLIKNIREEDPDEGWGALQNSNPVNFTSYQNHVFFTANNPNDNAQLLYKTDGTATGTSLLIPDPSTQSFWNPNQLTVSGSKMFFVAEGYIGSELWVTDGSQQGTSLTKDIKLHYRGSAPVRLTAFKNILYFQADNGGNGYELYRSDGTKAGTYIVKDLRREDLGSGDELAPLDMGNMVTTTEALYFTALRSTGKNALWKSNGIAAGTLPVKDFPGQPAAEIIAVNENEITIALSYDTHMEIWKSNGTSTGTLKVKTISDLHSLVYPVVTAQKNNVTYFIGTTGVANKVYRTDGTDHGTYEITFDGTPYDLEKSGNYVYLSGYTERYGWELFTIDDVQSDVRLASDQESGSKGESNGDEISSLAQGYPNPFHNSFSIHVPGEENTRFRMKILTLDGKLYEQKEDLKHNATHELGTNWQPGFYIMQVQTGNKLISQKLIKR